MAEQQIIDSHPNALAVDLAIRREALISALSALSTESALVDDLQLAKTKGGRDQLRSMHKKDYPTYIDGVPAQAITARETAREQFDIAFGVEKLRIDPDTSVEDAKTLSDRAYPAFRSDYYGIGGSKKSREEATKAREELLRELTK